MSRIYAQIQLSIWDDEDFLDLSMPAQWLYFYLSTNADLSYAGVTDWRIKKIRPKAAALTLDVLEAAAAELIDAVYIVVDDDTEEVLVRSFMRADGLLKQKNMGAAVAKAYSSIASRHLRAVVVHELLRLQTENPSWGSWNGLTDVLQKTSINPFGNPSVKGSVKGSSNPSVKGSATPSPDPSDDPPVKVLVSPSGKT